MEQFDKRKGTLKPARKDDLKDGVSGHIGMYCVWEAMWEIEEGQYASQWAMSPVIDINDRVALPFSWVPECDIIFDL